MHCLNCEFPLNENNQFCAQCGAKVVRERLTLKWYVNEFTENFLKVDNKLFKTFAILITKPERVVNGYIKGLRKKYFAPISFLIVALTLSGLNIFLLKNGYLGDIDYTRFTSREQATALDSPEYMERYMNTVYDYYNVLLFLSIPFLALTSKIVFHNLKQFNFFEHLVLYTYTYSLCSMVGFVLICFNIFFKIDYVSFSLSLSILYIIYHFYALKRIFSLSVKQILLKTLLFVPVILVLYFLIILIFTIIVLLYVFSGQI